MRITIRNSHREELEPLAGTRVLVYRQRDRHLAAELEAPASTFELEGIDPGELYHVRVFPPKHRAACRFARGREAITLYHPVRPEAVRRIHVYDQDALAEVVRCPAELGHEEVAGLLNLLAKLDATPVGTAPASGFIKAVSRVNRDRLWFEPHEGLRELVEAAAGRDFRSALGTLHHLSGYRMTGSFKTLEMYGNLQLTFFESESGNLVDQVEADIDDAGGLAHAFQVLRNTISGRTTHPYDIHEILTFYQELDTGYRLIV